MAPDFIRHGYEGLPLRQSGNYVKSCYVITLGYLKDDFLFIYGANNDYFQT